MPKIAISKSDLCRLVKEHGGNRSAIAESLCDGGIQITRQWVCALIARAGLEGMADDLRNHDCAPGPRRSLSDKERRVERARILAALARSPNALAASALLGMATWTIYRKIAFHAITDAEIARASRRR